jgi:hypothetical protein
MGVAAPTTMAMTLDSLKAQVGALALSLSLLVKATPTPTPDILLHHLILLEDRLSPSAKYAGKPDTLQMCAGTSSTMNSSPTLILLVALLLQAMLIPIDTWISAPQTT